MFWDATNNRLGIGTNAPSTTLTVAGGLTLSSGILSLPTAIHTVFDGKYRFWFQGQNRWTFDSLAANQGYNFLHTATTANAFNITNASGSQFLINGAGNVLINSSTDSGERLQVTGNVKIKGSGNTSATTALTVQNSSGANILRVRNDGFYLFGDSGSRPLFATVSAISTPNVNGTALQFAIDNASARTTTGFDFLFSYGTRDYTSGNVDVHRETANYTPTSGTGTFNMLVLQNTINQTGGANGITRGLYVNPTLTAAADFRAIETARGNVVFGNLPTSPVGLPTGAIWNNLGMINIV
jgi:hypothetical protein